LKNSSGLAATMARPARNRLTAIIALAIGSLLLWQHFHEGVPAHHFLQRADMPAISNWWGALLLPALTWFLAGRVDQRHAGRYPPQVLAGFAGGLLCGVLLATLFALGYNDAIDKLMLGLLLVALLYPVYRAECMLGFVIGMSYTFGAVLPTLFACVFALLAFVLHQAARSALGLARKLAARRRLNR
jgi:hypothetical protein